MKRLLIALLFLSATAGVAGAGYRFQGLGTFGALTTDATDIDDLGRVSGLLSGA